MPVQSARKERPLIELFLSGYEGGAWKSATMEWLEDKKDGAVEVLVTRSDKVTLAIEHTLIQPFVGEKTDTERFMKAFSKIEKNPELILAERAMTVSVPVYAIPKGPSWDEIGDDLFAWLKDNHRCFSEGQAQHLVKVGKSWSKGPLEIKVGIDIMSLPKMAGYCWLARYAIPDNLAENVEKALKTKLPKLINTSADRRILLLEREQSFPSELQIYSEISKRRCDFQGLEHVDEIWFANTTLLATDDWVSFELINGQGLIELMNFENGALKLHRVDRKLARR